MTPEISVTGTYQRDFVLRTGLGTDAYAVTPRSPWPSEIFALYCVGRTYGVRRWVESGTYHGQAAEVLARAMPDAEIYTVEVVPEVAEVAERRLAPLAPQVRVVRGRGEDEVPRLVADVVGPVGVFLDGPKSLEAVVLARYLLERYPAVAFVGAHDMPRSVSGRATPGRAAIECLGTYEHGLTWWATDDEEWVAATRHLDEGLHAAHITESGASGWRPYEHFVGDESTRMLSYGPTVAVLIRR